MWRHAPERITFRAKAYRQVSAQYDPLWEVVLPGAAGQAPGRWNRPGQVAQYLSLTQDAAWAEWVRQAGIHSLEESDASDPRRMWGFVLDECDIADLSSLARYHRCGIDPHLAVGPHGDAWPLADALRSEGYRGVLSPAAGINVRDAISLTLFGTRLSYLVNVPDDDSWPSVPDDYVVAFRVATRSLISEYVIDATCHAWHRHWLSRTRAVA